MKKEQSPKNNTKPTSSKKWDKAHIQKLQKMFDAMPKGGLDVVGALKRIKK